ncbi:hypothetical protein [Sphingobacterium sp. BN32]|uniref:hypothetical protein n=1 Tax=Sphingobacterium sp. BN32 TaxID=3058432 RepID=UPI00265D26D0|nr:hypothetical protein [Sphingobacterium sp. BN32]WKK60289.1 hypothetical protein QYC40_08600 [Sphingobacterium sp. BN32]
MFNHVHTPELMFKFSTKLHVWKNRVKKNGNISIYLFVYISAPGNIQRDFYPLNIEWPLIHIDFAQDILRDQLQRNVAG